MVFSSNIVTDWIEKCHVMSPKVQLHHVQKRNSVSIRKLVARMLVWGWTMAVRVEH